MARTSKVKGTAKQLLQFMEHGVTILKHYIEKGGEEIEELFKAEAPPQMKRKRGRPRKNPVNEG